MVLRRSGVRRSGGRPGRGAWGFATSHGQSRSPGTRAGRAKRGVKGEERRELWRRMAEGEEEEERGKRVLTSLRGQQRTAYCRDLAQYVVLPSCEKFYSSSLLIIYVANVFNSSTTRCPLSYRESFYTLQHSKISPFSTLQTTTCLHLPARI